MFHFIKTSLSSCHQRKIDQIKKKHHSFGFSDCLGNTRSKDTLKQILNDAEIFGEKRKLIVDASTQKENFLISLLKTECTEVIYEIYDLPYIVLNLHKDRYETDPKQTDSEGLSAFYYALQGGKFRILYVLHAYAANAFFETDASISHPDKIIVSNLENVGNILKNDRAKLEKVRYCKSKQQAMIFSYEIININEFYTEITRRILEINHKVYDNEAVSEEIFDANKIKEIVLKILESYDEFFNIEKREKNSFEVYKEYKNYHDVVDSTVTGLFFSYIFLLKNKVRLGDGTSYSEIEQTFVLYLVMMYTSKDMSDSLSEENSFHFIVPFVQRQELRNEIRNFMKNLKNTQITNENLLRQIAEEEVHKVFDTYQEIKDNLLLDRLYLYRETVTGSSYVPDNNIKSILAIERVLQVMGECVYQGKSNFPVKRLLKLQLGANVSKLLLDIRNGLCHLPVCAFPCKFETEKKFPNLFLGIKDEIREIWETLDIVEAIAHQSIHYFIRDHIRMTIVQAENLSRTEFHSRFGINMKNLVNALDEWDRYDEEEDAYFYRENIDACQLFFDSIFGNVEAEIKNPELWKTFSDSSAKRVENILWPVQFIMKSLMKCKVLKDESLYEIFQKGIIANCASAEEMSKKAVEIISASKNVTSKFFRSETPIKTQTFFLDNIQEFWMTLKPPYFLERDKEEYRNAIPKSVMLSIAAKEKVIAHLEGNRKLRSKGQLYEKVQQLYLSKTKKNKLEKYLKTNNDAAALKLAKEAADPVSELEEMFKTKSIDKGKFNTLCDNLELPQAKRIKLNPYVKGENKIREQNGTHSLLYALNRINLLKNILIDRDPKILRLWNKRKTTQTFIVDRIAQIYLRESKVRASVEILLSDCMCLFGKDGEFRQLWTKTSNLYGGVNVRNYVNHGNPMLRLLSRLLYPKEIAWELVEKMLVLMEDGEAIKAILQLSTNRNRSEFLELIQKGSYKSRMRNRILECPRWEMYASLIPE